MSASARFTVFPGGFLAAAIPLGLLPPAAFSWETLPVIELLASGPTSVIVIVGHSADLLTPLAGLWPFPTHVIASSALSLASFSLLPVPRSLRLPHP